MAKKLSILTSYLPIRHFIDFLHFSLPSKTALTNLLKYWIVEECPLRAVVLAVGSFHQAEFFPKIRAGSNPVAASKSPECPPDPPDGHTVPCWNLQKAPGGPNCIVPI